MARCVQPLVGMVSDPKARSASNAGTTADTRQAETPPQGEAQREVQQSEKKQPKKENPDA
jgi:hypothetical protein